MRIIADYHTHTVHSHGTGTVEDNVKAAIRQGLQILAISDHGPASLFGVGVRTLETFQLIRQEIAICQRKYPRLKILLGVEANIVGCDGELDIPPSCLQEFDIVQAGLHLLVRPASWYSGITLVAGNLAGRYWPQLQARLRQVNTDAIVAAITRNPIDILTHPGLHISIDTTAIARACAASGTFMEINASHHHITPEYLQIAYEAGARFVIGSDAHSPSRVGDFVQAIKLVKAAGIPLSAIHNAVDQQETPAIVAKSITES